jgi:hypothetical protein
VKTLPRRSISSVFACSKPKKEKSDMSSRKTRGSLAATFTAAALCLGLTAAFINPLWTDPAGATKTLEDSGFSNVKPGGYSWFGCGKGDLYHTTFKATNAQGKQVSGVVCKGVFKGSTIRFD